MGLSTLTVEETNLRRRRDAGLLRTVRAGFAHHRAGRLGRAEALYRNALRKDPDNANALHLLGVIAYQGGKIALAIELLERALPVLPDVPDAHLNYGNALREAGRLAEAVASYRRAIGLKPDYGMAHNNLASALNEQRIYKAGLTSAERAIELIPEFFGAHVNRGDSLIGLERWSEAEAPLRRAIELSPDRAESHRDLGWVLARLGRCEEAVACHQRAIALEPHDATMHYALGATSHLAHDLAGSEASLRRALALAPDYPPAWHELGTVLRSAGRFAEAISCFDRALELDPDAAEVHRSLAVTGRRAADEAQLQRLRAMLASAERPVSDRISAGFALGTLLDNDDRFDEAFPCFADANALYRQQCAAAGKRFDIAALRRQLDELIGTITATLLSAAGCGGNPSEAPVFIVGMPRTGTTLVEQIAASHSRVFGAGERREMSTIADALLTHHCGLAVEKWNAPFARRLADQHVAQLQALGGGAVRVIDKMPDNIFLLWMIAALFPAARVILCRRDLRDVCLSCFFHRFTEGHLYAYDLVDCALRALEVERLAAHWLRVLPLRMLVVDYEELVQDQERQSRRLIEFLGLDWEPGCLDFHRTERPLFTASAWQVRQPLNRGSLGRWRRYERHLEPLCGVLQRCDGQGGGRPFAA